MECTPEPNLPVRYHTVSLLMTTNAPAHLTHQAETPLMIPRASPTNTSAIVDVLILDPPRSRLLRLRQGPREISVTPIMADAHDTGNWLVTWLVLLNAPYDRSSGTVALSRNLLLVAFGCGGGDTSVVPGKFARFHSFLHVPFNAPGYACIELTKDVQNAIESLLGSSHT